MGKTLYIIDGHAQIYRAYYAVMGLRSPTGEPTNATFGFAGMLLKLFQMRKPTHVVLAMDAGTSGRETLDAAYKVHRKPMPEDMPQQIERISQIVEMAGIPIYRAEGYEADDVMATLVKKVRASEGDQCKIYMCTKDKDLDQLIDEQTVMYDIQTNEEIDPAALLAKKGYTPGQARDVLALTGDAVDNIPGVPGVGPKTAAKWIAEFGSLDELVRRSAEVKGKAGETLRANLPVLENSRKLVELQFDVPLGVNASATDGGIDWEKARVRPELLPRLAGVFQELGFSRMMGQLEGVVKSYRGSADAPDLGPVATAPDEPKIQGRTAAPASRKPADEIPGGLFSFGAETEAGTLGSVTSEDQSNTAPLSESGSLQGGLTGSVGALREVEGDFVLINTVEKLEAMVKELEGELQRDGAWLAVDTETDALGSMASNLCGISLSAREGHSFYVAVKGTGDAVLGISTVKEKLGPLLENEQFKKVGQNLKYDMNSLRKAGIVLKGMAFDTMVASYVLDSTRMSHGMDGLAADLLGLKPIPITDVIGTGKKQVSFADVPLDRACRYAAEDADVTLRLANLMRPRIDKCGFGKLFYELEMPLVQVLADMEYEGVLVDVALLGRLSEEIGKKLEVLAVKIREAAGVDFNHDSPKQLAKVLFEHLKLPVIKKTKTGPSTDISVLEKLADKHAVPALIVEYRQLTKLKGTYLDTLAKLPNKITGRVHAHFNQTVAETGRLSSSDPNLQNIPVKTEIGREIRKAFIASPGHVLIVADYSQIELRMLAHYCGEKALIEAFEKNRDVHRLVAAELNHVIENEVTPEMRAVAKTVNFGIIYGQTAFGLAEVLKIPQEQASAYITAYKRRFPAIEQFTHECVQQAAIHGWVETILGRRRMIPDINSPIQARRQFGARAALNSVIQGSAADLIKLAMVNICRKQKTENIRYQSAKLIMQIHDELVFECLADEAEEVSAFVRREMEGAMALKVPLKVDLGVGANWLDAE